MPRDLSGRPVAAPAHVKVLWRRCFMRMARSRYQQKLAKHPNDFAAHKGLGSLHYADGDLEQALAHLAKAASANPRDADVHHLLAKTEVRRWEATGQAALLTNAQAHYARMLKVLPLGVTIIAEVPTVLEEMARLYESFGAFEGALELYGRVVEYFPSYSNYDNVLYRSAKVMKHMSTLPGADAAALSVRCKEFLEFVLEERPASVGNSPLASDEAVLFMYARICEATPGDPAAEAKAEHAYDRCFSIRRAAGKEDAQGVDGWRAWLEEAATWRALAGEFTARGERTEAADCFEECVAIAEESAARQAAHYAAQYGDDDDWSENSDDYGDSDDGLPDLRRYADYAEGGGEAVAGAYDADDGGGSRPGTAGSAASRPGTADSAASRPGTADGVPGRPKRKRKRKRPPPPDLEALDVATLIDIAKNYAGFQNMDAALKYACKALESDNMSELVRGLLSEWSPEHKEMFEHEQSSARQLQRQWR